MIWLFHVETEQTNLGCLALWQFTSVDYFGMVQGLLFDGHC